MRPLSASEAISPAFDRTRTILFRPFRKGRSWKLAATAYLSAMGLAFIPTPLAILPALSHGTAGAVGGVLVLAVIVLITAIMLLFFYLGSRLQFVLFAIVLEKGDIVAPLWRRYGSCTWRWLGLKLALSVGFCLLFGVPVYSLFRSLIAHLPVQPGQPPSPQMVASILLLYAFIFLPIGLLMLCSSLLSDFVLPSIALEDATISNAIGRFIQLIKAEPMQVVVFTLFKILLAIAGAVAMQIVVLFAEIVAAIPLGLLALLAWFLFRSLGPAGHVLLVAGAVTLMLILAVFLFYVMILVMGCVHMFYQAYALYFLGGRYPLLGNILEPPVPYPVAPPPLTTKDEGGPALPADPSPA
jgi:hypothetical protein